MPQVTQARAHFGNCKPSPASASSMKAFHPQPIRRVQNMQSKRLPKGNSVLETMKSSRSSTPLPAPRGWNPESTLKPRTQGSESRTSRIALTRQTRPRRIPLWSIQ